EGLTGDEPPLIKFKLDQGRPGMSGAPLLNQRTGKVCGVVKFTRDRSTDLGGGAVPVSVVLSQFEELVELQQQFHQHDKRWRESIRQEQKQSHGKRRTEPQLRSDPTLDFYSGEDIKDATRYYIPPHCSSIDPTQGDEMHNGEVTSESLFEVVDTFL